MYGRGLPAHFDLILESSDTLTWLCRVPPAVELGAALSFHVRCLAATTDRARRANKVCKKYPHVRDREGRE
jgi:hypothetical protein